MLRGINQALMIENLLKKCHHPTYSQVPNINSPLHIRLDELSRAYNELVKKFKILDREKCEMQLTIEELTRLNNMLENEFDGFFKTL
jgi:hypothetical protein